jgi:DedD protein
MRDTEPARKPAEQAARPESEKDTLFTDDNGEDIRRRLLLRIGVAVLLIVGLLGGLAILDEMSAPEKEPIEVASAPPQPATAPQPSASAPLPPVPPLTNEATESLPQDAESPHSTHSSTAAAQESSAAPTLSAPTQTNAPAPATPGLRPLTAPATARLAMMRPSESTRTPQNPLPPAAELARSGTPPSHAPASRPLSQALARASASNNLLLQLGVFSSTAHAEELRAKLELNGIPAQIESRVQVGPFASREEAEQMREKLKKLGLDGGVLVATKK